MPVREGQAPLGPTSQGNLGMGWKCGHQAGTRLLIACLRCGGILAEAAKSQETLFGSYLCRSKPETLEESAMYYRYCSLDIYENYYSKAQEWIMIIGRRFHLRPRHIYHSVYPDMVMRTLQVRCDGLLLEEFVEGQDYGPGHLDRIADFVADAKSRRADTIDLIMGLRVYLD